MVIQSERWFRDPAAVMAEVCDYLGLPRLERLPRVMRNRNKPHEPYDPEVLARLREFYRPYNEALADHLDMDLDWDEPSEADGPGPRRPTTVEPTPGPPPALVGLAW